jgi:hypothetical protein
VKLKETQHCNRLTVHQHRFESPLLDSLFHGTPQNWVALSHSHAIYTTIPSDQNISNDVSFNAN